MYYVNNILIELFNLNKPISQCFLHMSFFHVSLSDVNLVILTKHIIVFFSDLTIHILLQGSLLEYGLVRRYGEIYNIIFMELVYSHLNAIQIH